jgi:hypothetical protein
MVNLISETKKKSLLVGLYKRVKNRVRFLGSKKRQIIAELKKKSDTNKIEKLRKELLS